MDLPQGPWLQNWRDPKELGNGGQGVTFSVTRISDGKPGVLKLLKHNEDAQSRGRMNREVANLESLLLAKAKVPQVYESNTAEFKKDGLPLYFVMEFIDGKPLNDFVQKPEKVSIETAIDITLDLCSTIKIAHGENGGILHRDIKPANIIARNPLAGDIVIVDYGLSVNKSEPGDTRRTETIKNEFLTLPECSVDGDDRRDKRSDLAALCAILCYCFTKAYPRQLHDREHRLPHRRPGCVLRELIGDDKRVEWLNSFLDKGLAWNPEDRFQDVSEVISRLSAIKNGVGERPKLTAKEAAREATDLLHKHDRKTHLSNFRVAAKPIFDALQRFASENYNQFGEHFALAIGPVAQKPPAMPQGYDQLPMRFDVKIDFDRDRDGRIITYILCAQKSECTFFRLLSNKDGGYIAGNQWVPTFTYDGMHPPDKRVIVDDLDATISECIQQFIKQLNLPR